MKISSGLRKSLFIGSIRTRNIVLIECILNYDTFKEDERRDLMNIGFNMTSNYMKRTVMTDAETTPLIYAIIKADRQLINFLLADEDTDPNLLNRPLINQSPMVSF